MQLNQSDSPKRRNRRSRCCLFDSHATGDVVSDVLAKEFCYVTFLCVL